MVRIHVLNTFVILSHVLNCLKNIIYKLENIGFRDEYSWLERIRDIFNAI